MPQHSRKPRLTRFQIAVHLAALFPMVWLLWDSALGNLSADPVQAIIARTGQAAILILILSLSVTPIYIVTGFKPVRKVRRAVGLYAFFYTALHVLAYAWLDYGLDFYQIGLDVFDRDAAKFGLAAFFILLLLAVTSTKGWQRRLKKGWIKLHKLAYVAAVLVLLHFIWVQKADISEPLAWTAFLVLLFIVRLPMVRKWFTSRRSRKVVPRRERLARQMKVSNAESI